MKINTEEPKRLGLTHSQTKRGTVYRIVGECHPCLAIANMKVIYLGSGRAIDVGQSTLFLELDCYLWVVGDKQ